MRFFQYENSAEVRHFSFATFSIWNTLKITPIMPLSKYWIFERENRSGNREIIRLFSGVLHFRIAPISVAKKCHIFRLFQKWGRTKPSVVSLFPMNEEGKRGSQGAELIL
jgi:hypothetical protein